MATPGYFLCDKCGSQTEHRLQFTVDRKMDAAGSMDDECRTVDVCGDCAIGFLRMMSSLRPNVFSSQGTVWSGIPLSMRWGHEEAEAVLGYFTCKK